MRTVAEPAFCATQMRRCNVSLTACGPVLGDLYMGSGNGLASAVTFGRIAGASAAARGLAAR